MDDIDAILDYADEVLDELRVIHAETLDLDEPSQRFKVRIKSVLQNQRSSLDYLAQAIADRFGKAGNRPYYPLAKSDTVFDAELEDQIPGVAAARSDIRDAIERHQPYRDAWMREMNQLTRINKHQRLTRPGKIHLTTIVHTPTYPRRSQVLVPYVAWLFAELDRPVIDVLDEFQRGVREAVADICHVAGL